MNDYGYGLWPLVIFNSLLFIVFAVSFFHPKGGERPATGRGHHDASAVVDLAL